MTCLLSLGTLAPSPCKEAPCAGAGAPRFPDLRQALLCYLRLEEPLALLLLLLHGHFKVLLADFLLLQDC